MNIEDLDLTGCEKKESELLQALGITSMNQTCDLADATYLTPHHISALGHKDCQHMLKETCPVFY